jgi:NADH dehydrogenase
MLRILLLSSGDRILTELSPALGRYALTAMGRRGVEIRLNIGAAGYDGNELALSDGTKIATRLVVWTAGITPSPLLSQLPCSLERGRIVTEATLALRGWPGVWALGDCALVPDVLKPGKYCPPTAQHAIRQAKVVADNILADFQGRPPRPFRFKMLGMLATIGRRTGVAEILGFRFSGIAAWALWRTIYLGKLPGVQKKIRVALDWTLDVLFSKDIVQVPTLRSRTISESEASKHQEDVRAPELSKKRS